jgi:hypothetical protein
VHWGKADDADHTHYYYSPIVPRQQTVGELQPRATHIGGCESCRPQSGPSMRGALHSSKGIVRCLGFQRVTCPFVGCPSSLPSRFSPGGLCEVNRSGYAARQSSGVCLGNIGKSLIWWWHLGLPQGHRRRNLRLQVAVRRQPPFSSCPTVASSRSYAELQQASERVDRYIDEIFSYLYRWSGQSI